jgi:flagellar hook protein FlgE
MGSSFQYSILSGFRNVSRWQENIIRNAQNLLVPGSNKTVLHFGGTPNSQSAGARLGSNQFGGQSGVDGGGDSLALTRTSIDFEQGLIEPAYNPTSLGIKGKGFFIVAENLRPGAKVFLTRNGDFHYDAEGRLVNNQGLFVVSNNGIDANGNLPDPPRPVFNPGDGTVRPADVALGAVGSPSELGISGYGSTVYELTMNAGPLKAFNDGRPEVGFIQTFALENRDRAGATGALETESAHAQQTYKIFKDMLENFNKTDDDALGLVK